MSSQVEPESVAQQAQARQILASQNATAAQKAQYESSPSAEQALIAQYQVQQQARQQSANQQVAQRPTYASSGSTNYTIDVGGSPVTFGNSQELINYVTAQITTTKSNGKTYYVVPSIGGNSPFLAGDSGTAYQYIGSLAGTIGKPNTSVQGFYQGPSGEAYGTSQSALQAYKSQALSQTIASIKPVAGGIQVNIPGLGLEVFHTVAEAQTAANEVINYEYSNEPAPALYSFGGYSYLSKDQALEAQSNSLFSRTLGMRQLNMVAGEVYTVTNPINNSTQTFATQSEANAYVQALQTEINQFVANKQSAEEYSSNQLINNLAVLNFEKSLQVSNVVVGVSETFVGPLQSNQVRVSSNPTIAARQIAAAQFSLIASKKPFITKAIDAYLTKAISTVNTPLQQSSTAYSHLGDVLTQKGQTNTILGFTTRFGAGLSYEAAGLVNFFAISTGKGGNVKQNIPSTVGTLLGFAAVGTIAVEALPEVSGIGGTALRATTFGAMNAGFSAVQGASPIQIGESFALGAGLSAGLEIVSPYVISSLSQVRTTIFGPSFMSSVGKVGLEGTLAQAKDADLTYRYITNPEYESSIIPVEKAVAQTDLIQEVETKVGNPNLPKVTGNTSPNFNPKYMPPPNTGQPIGDTFNILGKESDIGKIKTNKPLGDLYTTEATVQQPEINNEFAPSTNTIEKAPNLSGEYQLYARQFGARMSGYDFQEEYNPVDNYVRMVNSGKSRIGGDFGYNYRPLVSLIGGTIPVLVGNRSVKQLGGPTLGGKVTQQTNQSQYNAVSTSPWMRTNAIPQYNVRLKQLIDQTPNSIPKSTTETQTTPVTTPDETPVTTTFEIPINTPYQAPKLGNALDIPTVAQVFTGYDTANTYGFLPEFYERRKKKKGMKAKKRTGGYKEFENPVGEDPLASIKNLRVPENLGGRLKIEFRRKRK